MEEPALEVALWGKGEVADRVTAEVMEENLRSEGRRRAAVPPVVAEEIIAEEGEDDAAEERAHPGRDARAWDPAEAANIVSATLFAETDGNQELWVYSPLHGHKISSEEGKALFGRAVHFLFDWWGPGTSRDGVGGDKFTSHKLGDVFNLAKTAAPSFAPGVPKDPFLLGFKNGVLDLRTLALLPHSPETGITRLVPHRWNPEAVCPEYEALLERTIPEEGERRIWLEATGSCLAESDPPTEMVVLTGVGSTGKSQALAVDAHLVGPEHHVSVSPQDLGASRFAKFNLRGMAANLPSEISGMRVEDTGPFKELLGGDMVTAERKGVQEPVRFRNRATWKGTGNSLPSPGIDRSSAFRRRFIPLGAGNPIGPRDEGWEREIGKRIARKEAEGIIVAAVRAYKNFLDRGGYYEIPDSVTARARQWWRESNDFAAFVSEKIRPSEDGLTGRDDLREAFREWCGAENVDYEKLAKKTDPLRRIMTEIRSNIPGVESTTLKGKPYHGFVILPAESPESGKTTDSTAGDEANWDLPQETAGGQQKAAF